MKQLTEVIQDLSYAYKTIMFFRENFDVYASKGNILNEYALNTIKVVKDNKITSFERNEIAGNKYKIFTVRDSIGKYGKIDRVLEILEEHGYLSRNKLKSTTKYYVNPEVFKLN